MFEILLIESSLKGQVQHSFVTRAIISKWLGIGIDIKFPNKVVTKLTLM